MNTKVGLSIKEKNGQILLSSLDIVLHLTSKKKVLSINLSDLLPLPSFWFQTEAYFDNFVHDFCASDQYRQTLHDKHSNHTLGLQMTLADPARYAGRLFITGTELSIDSEVRIILPKMVSVHIVFVSHTHEFFW